MPNIDFQSCSQICAKQLGELYDLSFNQIINKVIRAVILGRLVAGEKESATKVKALIYDSIPPWKNR